MNDRLPTCAEWLRLVENPVRQELFVDDLYFRECWNDAVSLFGSGAIDIVSRAALMSFKPEAIVGRRMGQALEIILAQRFVPVAFGSSTVSRHLIRELWRYDWTVFPIDRLVLSTFWYTSTEMPFLLFRDPEALPAAVAARRLSRLKGAYKNGQYSRGSLRQMLDSPNRMLNFVHIADEPADVVRELGIAFARNERLAVLKKLAMQADSSGPMLEYFDNLYARYPAHDLRFDRSLQRLCDSGRLLPRDADYLRCLAANDRCIGWDELVEMTEPDIAWQRWDFICVASRVIHALRPDQFRSPTKGASHAR